MNLEFYYNQAMEYENYIKLLGDNLSLHKLHYKNFSIQKEDRQLLEKLQGVNILVISEPWCGDSIALLPIVKKISEVNSNWRLKVLLRDENPDLIDRFQTNGGRAIPIFLFLNSKCEYIFKWGPRPVAAQNIFDKYREQINNGEVEKSKILLKIRQYYSKDRGNETSKELLNIIIKHFK